jgi:hypothetical protein
MTSLPGLVYLIDCKKERIAVSEAVKLGIPVMAIVDTNVDPDPIDYVIPGNDDAMKSIRLITRLVAKSVEQGMTAFNERKAIEQKTEEPAKEAAPAEGKEAPKERPATHRPRTSDRGPGQRRPREGEGGRGRSASGGGRRPRETGGPRTSGPRASGPKASGPRARPEKKPAPTPTPAPATEGAPEGKKEGTE